MITPDLIALSPNYSMWEATPRAIMLHATRGGPNSTDDFQATINWFGSRASRASSQWLVGQNGRKARIVPDEFAAWHAMDHSGYSLSIEMEQRTVNEPFTEIQVVQAALIVRDYCDTYDIPRIRVPGLRQGQ